MKKLLIYYMEDDDDNTYYTNWYMGLILLGDPDLDDELNEYY
jgi:hypothetical protein